MRSITEEAGVNAAAIHYHFGSKETLLEAVLARRVLPLNQEQLKRLEQLEMAVAGGPLPTRELLEAFLAPLVALRAELGDHTAPFGNLMAWLWIERDLYPRPPALFDDLLSRFADAACQGREDLEPDEAAERLEYAVGATSQVLQHASGDSSLAELREIEARLDRLVSFLAAGLEMPGRLRPGESR